MPRYDSIGGKWYPANEKVLLTDVDIEKGENPIYEGPDRAAIKELESLGLEFHGQDYSENEDMLERVRNLGYSTIDEYLEKRRGIKREEYLKKQETKHKKTVTTNHDKKNLSAPKKFPSGGDNTANLLKGSLKGGFDDPEYANSSDLGKRA